MAHRNQGTGSYKGNRDRHEKKQGNSAKSEKSWVDQGKHTNSERNRERGSIIGGLLKKLIGK